MKFEFNLNGKTVSPKSDLSMRLLDVIRDEYGLTGTKEGCAEGECGACLVFVDDLAVNSCIMPLSNVIGKNVVTIEGYRESNEYKGIEKAFLDRGAVQCGFCIPGMVMATGSLMKTMKNPSDEDIKVFLSGNLCRCTGYDAILEAVKDVAYGGDRDENL